MVWWLSRDRRSLDILSVKKEAKLSASEIPGIEEGKGDGDLRCRSLLTVCQSYIYMIYIGRTAFCATVCTGAVQQKQLRWATVATINMNRKEGELLCPLICGGIQSNT